MHHDLDGSIIVDYLVLEQSADAGKGENGRKGRQRQVIDRSTDLLDLLLLLLPLLLDYRLLLLLLLLLLPHKFSCRQLTDQKTLVYALRVFVYRLYKDP